MGESKIVVVHDYATQRGGAERVAIDLLRAFPGSRLVTSCWNPENTFPEFNGFDVETLPLNRFATFRSDPRKAFPLLARAFSEHIVADADVVICSSSGWSHMISTPAPKIVYCHNPARWLYQPADYFADVPRAVRAGFGTMSGNLRRRDAVAARSAVAYVVNSTGVGRRVRASYGIEPRVVAPARGLSPQGAVEPVPGVEPGYLLTVSRRRGYKHTDVIRQAMAQLPDERLVVVGGENVGDGPRVTTVSDLTDAQLRWLYANAAGLVAVGHEDFGLTPVEAQGFGVPSVVLRAGGYLDSTVENVTGVFVDSATADAVAAGVRRLRSRPWDAAAIQLCGERFAADAFAARMRRVVADVLSPRPVVPTPVSALHAMDVVQTPLRSLRDEVELTA